MKFAFALAFLACVSAVSATYVLQEFANVSVGSGTLSNGTYSLANDSGIGYMYMNYSKPPLAASNSYWQVLHGLNSTGGAATTGNFTIPEACMGDTVQLRFYSRAGIAYGTSYGQCYASTGWTTITNVSNCTSSSLNSNTPANTTWNDGSYNASGTFYYALGGGSYEWAGTSLSTTTSGCGGGFYAAVAGKLNEEGVWWNIQPNMLNITLVDEDTGALITANVTVKLSTDTYENTNTTTSGRIGYENLTPSTYVITGSATGYPTRYYLLDISTGSNYTVTLYLGTGTANVTFTVKDQDVATLLEDAIISMARLYNSTWTTIEALQTDITGTARMEYSAGVRYRFTASKSGYEDKIFYLDPVQYSDYDVLLSRESVLNDTQDFANVATVLAPTNFYDDTTSTFYFTIVAPSSILTSYGYTITYPGGTNTTSGIDAIGSTLSTGITISGASTLSTVNVSYFYVVDGYQHNFTTTFPIIANATAAPGTLLDTSQNLFGLGDFERVLIATIVTILVAGAASVYAGPIAASMAVMMMYGLFYFAGLIPLWTMLIVVVSGFLFVTWRGSQ